MMKPLTEQHLAILRRHMVEIVEMNFDLLSDEIGKDALDPALRRALMEVPRHLFVPHNLAAIAYQDSPLPIGFDKTISQPFIVALMTDLLAPQPHETVLEIGTGFGYQTAILAELAQQVWSVEVIEEFANGAAALLEALGYDNVGIRVGDGSRGWPEHEPFDKIIATVAAEHTPQAWIDQLKPGGRMVLPLGAEEAQFLTVIDKDAAGKLAERKLIPVRFSRLETV
jgi:protein-L-isoaspartate(D-aspartate) O-methyltransferase